MICARPDRNFTLIIEKPTTFGLIIDLENSPVILRSLGLGLGRSMFCGPIIANGSLLRGNGCSRYEVQQR